MVDTPEPVTQPRVTVQRWGEAVGRTLEGIGRALGGTAYVPFRVIALLAIAMVAIAFAPLPVAAIGGVAMLLLTLDIGRHRR
jgi:hypothetical protein